MASTSAFSCFFWILSARRISFSTFAPMSATATTTNPACPVSRYSPSSLRSWRLIPPAACPPPPPTTAPPRRGGRQQPTAEGGEGEQRDHQTGRNPTPPPSTPPT